MENEQYGKNGLTRFWGKTKGGTEIKSAASIGYFKEYSLIVEAPRIPSVVTFRKFRHVFKEYSLNIKILLLLFNMLYIYYRIICIMESFYHRLIKCSAY